MTTINTDFIEMFKSICRGSEITTEEGFAILRDHLSKEEVCECGSTDICSRWKHKDKMCVKCCECDDCLARGEDMYGEWTCDDCGCEIGFGNECPDLDMPFCKECYYDLEECENCTRKFKESDGVFTECGKFYCEDCAESYVYTCDHCGEKHDEVAVNEVGEVLCLPCYEKKKVHPVAGLIKDTKFWKFMNVDGKENTLWREMCEEQNFYILDQFLKDTPYSLGEETLAGWGSADDFARARGEYEYEYE